MYFPNLEELSFRVVLALPKDSRMGFVANICFSISLASSGLSLSLDFAFVFSVGLTDARYRMMYLACFLSVKYKMSTIY